MKDERAATAPRRMVGSIPVVNNRTDRFRISPQHVQVRAAGIREKETAPGRFGKRTRCSYSNQLGIQAAPKTPASPRQ